MPDMSSNIIGGAVVFHEGKIALVQEAGTSARGTWNIPAGHIEESEDIITGTLREIKEETNLDVELVGLIGVYQGKSPKGIDHLRFFFKAKVIGGTLKHQEGELLDAKWITLDEFKKMDDSELRDDKMKRAILDSDTIVPLELLK
ncbi:MAG: NUDIX domain-containing protein [Nanoarchaeota archaeon]